MSHQERRLRDSSVPLAGLTTLGTVFKLFSKAVSDCFARCYMLYEQHSTDGFF